MRILTVILMLSFLILPVSALEITPPPVPDSAEDRMPEETNSIAEGMQQLLSRALRELRPDLRDAAKVSLGILAAVLMGSVLDGICIPARKAVAMACVAAVASTLLFSAGSMIRLATDTVNEITDYTGLLLPVMGSALAAQGHVTTSAALCAGTAMFTAIVQRLINKLLVPGVYVYLALGIGSSASGEDLLKRMADLLKGFIAWSLKLTVMIFTTYLSLTGAVSGTADAAALKAAKVGISTFVPVVGGVLSDASEAVLVGSALLKNSAGIYGIFAVLAIFLQPFLKTGIHYLILKLTGAVCSVFGNRQVVLAVDSFCGAMGLLLGMTACCCVLTLISTVCFLKGAV